MHRRQFAVLALAAAALPAMPLPVLAGSMPASWDGLVQVNSKRLRYVYLLPGADFRGYHKVMLDPTEVAFKKNWQRDFNRTSRELSSRVTESQIKRVIDEGGPAATAIFAKTYAAGGYPVVGAAGPDVLRIRTGIINLSVTAPDRMSAGRSRSYAGEAGYATLVIEARDSMTGALLGRAVDPRVAGDNTMALMRNSVTNRSDFRTLGERWAKSSVAGLEELKRLSPIAG
jgi:hypothetical protein